MRILGVGLSKTGTTSLYRALSLLGFRSLHYDDRRLNDVVDGSNPHPDFHRYNDVDAVLDIPTAVFYEELLEAYRECRCILSIRDENEWWESIRAHFNDRRPIACREQAPFKWDLRHYVYGSARATEFLFRKRFRQHNRQVCDRVPPERLLVIDVTAGEGWEKLCPFLGVDAPAAPFPHQNRLKEGGAGYRRLARHEILRLLPAGGKFVLIDHQALADEPFPDRQAVPFLERDGHDWGLPADDQAAIGEIDRLRSAGCGHVVFVWPAFWWFDHYVGLRRHLAERFRCIAQNDRVVVYDLRGDGEMEE